MLQMSVKLTEIEEKILSRGYGIGNDVLYKLCEDFPLEKICKNPNDTISEDKIKSWIVTSDNNKGYTMVNALAAQMWLIGRSYAASPERRDYGEKFDWDNSGNGLDSYFELLAMRLLNKHEDNDRYNYHNDLQAIVEKLSKIENEQKEQLEIDKDSLQISVAAVLSFNRLLKKARFAVDRSEIIRIKGFVDETDESLGEFENKQKNMLSFCSKFLHFHFPHAVFIMDSITFGNFSHCNSKKNSSKSFAFYYQGKDGVSEIKFTKIAINTIGKYLDEKMIVENIVGSNKKNDQFYTDKSERDYVKHCIHEYLLAGMLIKANPDLFKGKYIPRQLDTYMLIANSHLKKK